jgi:hypothetical protein
MATAAHSHLFPGARIRLDTSGLPHGYTGQLGPLAFRLSFADGSGSMAELIVADPADGEDEPLLAVVVAEYKTAAGALIPEKTWPVTRVEDEEGCRVLKLGKELRPE